MSRKIIGLDIRDDSVSAVLVLNAINGNQVASAYQVIRKEGPTDEPSPPFLDRALKELSTRIEFSGCALIVSLPARRFFFRNVSVPFRNRKKISQVLPFEIEPSLPVAVEETEIGFQAVKLADDGKLIAACLEKSFLSSLTASFGAYKISPDIVTISGYPTAIHLFNGGATGIFLDIEDTRVSVGIGVDGRICLYRNTPVRIDAADFPARIKTIVDHTLLAFYETFEIDLKPEKLFLTGHGLLKREMKKELEEAMGLPVEIPDLKTHFHVEISREMDYEGAAMDHALALAMTEITGTDTINFQERPFAGKKILMEYKARFIHTAILLGIVLGIALFGFATELTLLSRRIDALDQEIKKAFLSILPGATRVVEPVHQIRTAVEKLKGDRSASIQSANKRLAIELLNTISQKISPSIDVEVTQLVIGEDGVQLSGETDSFNSVDEMKKSLETLEGFTAVKINSATIDKGTKRIRFKIRISP